METGLRRDDADDICKLWLEPWKLNSSYFNCARSHSLLNSDDHVLSLSIFHSLQLKSNVVGFNYFIFYKKQFNDLIIVFEYNYINYVNLKFKLLLLMFIRGGY